MFVSEDKSEAVFAHFKILDEGNSPFLSAKLQGLDPDKKYTIAELDESYYGDELMNVGINIPKVRGDFTSVM
jgi:alpha-galactosidase